MKYLAPIIATAFLGYWLTSQLIEPVLTRLAAVLAATGGIR